MTETQLNCMNMGEPLWQSLGNDPWQERWVDDKGKLLEEYEWDLMWEESYVWLCRICFKYPVHLSKFRGLPQGTKPLTTKLEQDKLLGQLQGHWKIKRFPGAIDGNPNNPLTLCLFEVGFTDVSIIQDKMFLSGGSHKETHYVTHRDSTHDRTHRTKVTMDVTNGTKELRIIPFRGPYETFYIDNIGTKIVRISKDKGEIEIDNAMGNKGLLQRPWKHYGGVPPNPPPPNKPNPPPPPPPNKSAAATTGERMPTEEMVLKYFEIPGVSDYPRANMTMNDRGDAAAKEGRKQSNSKGIPSKGKKKTKKKKKKKKKENTIVDEIQELHKLKEQGILTEEEFQQAKTAVIAKSSAISAANAGTNTNPTAGEHVPADQSNPQQAIQQEGSSAGNNPPPYNPSYQYNPNTNAGGNSK